MWCFHHDDLTLLSSSCPRLPYILVDVSSLYQLILNLWLFVEFKLQCPKFSDSIAIAECLCKYFWDLKSWFLVSLNICGAPNNIWTWENLAVTVSQQRGILKTYKTEADLRSTCYFCVSYSIRLSSQMILFKEHLFTFLRGMELRFKEM